MTRADLIERISEKRKISSFQAAFLVNTIFDCMEQSIRRSAKIEIRGFGTFQVRSYKAYKGRNPRTGQIVEVKPKRLPHFKVSAELAARIDHRRGKRLGEPAAAASGIPVHQ
ncbi:MAG: HU family DNA-binding protein [Polyangia bacterium]|jgi:integration host factor subunit beta